MSSSPPSHVTYLRSLRSIRERCERIFAVGTSHGLRHFDVDLARADSVVDYVIDVTKDNYPDLNVPFHSRWRHFDIGGVDRVGALTQEWEKAGLDKDEICRRQLDLAVVSVLVDAGAGDRWRYREEATGKEFGRSEGLAVASLYLFTSGVLSNDGEARVDAEALTKLTPSTITKAFQVGEDNPLVGAETRAALLSRLGSAMQAHPTYFCVDGRYRPGNILDYLRTVSKVEEEGGEGG
eukprot:CAMPEP_0113887888 /NCGR_PEP_ID=MMETSP0780_2-20120614/12505_1 /TAXON_ID=652834 /ORGANISM="Palpitomonas bilix" /LENGTH=236 /DNA_ID=CAMNT_0000876553 /DNA_START=45 /DNA_END=751 /DNA_ORIENTATION=- /assembly_acc=CAM_ASM_000599